MEQLADRLLELLGREDVQETARLYFEQGDVTINFIWIAVAGLAVLLLLKPLLGIPLLDNIVGAMSGHGHGPSYGGGISSEYGAPSGGYGAPDAGYGAPDAGYGAPDAGYGAPDAGYGAPDAGYGAPDAGYGAPDAGYGAPAGDSGFNPGSSYDSPDSGYSAPQSGYSRGRRSVSLTEQQKSLYDIVKPQPELQSPLLASLALRAPVAPALEFARLS